MSIYSARPCPPTPKPDQGEKFVGGTEPSTFGNAVKLNPSTSPLEKVHTNPTIILRRVCIQWTYNGTMPSTHHPTPPSWWILMAWGWFGWWDRTGCAVVGGEGRCYLAQIPPANTPHPPA